MLSPYPSPLAEISLCALKENHKTLCRILGKSTLICVIKADAYGHGALHTVEALQESGASFFAVANGTEALALSPLFQKSSRFCKDKLSFLPKLHILGPISEQELLPLCALSVVLSVHSASYAEALDERLAAYKEKRELEASFRLPIALKCESGMNRLGIEHVSEALSVCRLKHLYPVSLYSHLAEADEEPDVRTNAQLHRFRAFAGTLSKCGYPLFTHLSASKALLRFGALGASGARAGLALYGACEAEGVTLSPAMRFSATVLSVKRVKRGEGVGYGSYRAPKNMRIACIGAGYADGLLPSASGARVAVEGTLCPIVGEICMDRAFLSIGELPLKEGMRLTLFGNTAADTIRFARECGISPYVLLSLRSTRTKKIFY